MTAALVPSSQLRMRGASSTANSLNLAASSHPPYFSHKAHWQGMSTSSIPVTPSQQYAPWRRRRLPSNRAATVLHSYSKEKSPFTEDAFDFDSEDGGIVDLEIDTSLQLMEKGSNSTTAAITNVTTAETSDTPLELWGMPVQSIVLLNLVAVIWGTQNSVIKSVVDDNTIELGVGFKWMENIGIHLSSLQNSIPSESSAGGDSTAAYFTLARFGLAALLASPYTPGIKEMLGLGESTTLVNGVDVLDDEEYEQSTQDQSKSGEKETKPKNIRQHINKSYDGESVRLAWRYGAELGLYMFLGYAFQAIGLETTTASRSGFLLYLNVKFVPFISYFIFGKQIKRSTWISALVAFSGTALLAFDNANAAGSTPNGLANAFTVGDLWSIGAAAASALFILRMEAASKAVSKSSELNAANLWTVAVLSFLWTMGISWNQLSGTEASADASAAFVPAIQQTFQQTISTIVRHPLPLIYLSAVTTALANFLQSKAQKDVSAERAAVIYAMDPVYGAIFANILLGETLGGLGLVGASLIVVAAATNAVMDFGGVGAEAGNVRDKEKR